MSLIHAITEITETKTTPPTKQCTISSLYYEETPRLLQKVQRDPGQAFIKVTVSGLHGWKYVLTVELNWNVTAL